MNKKIIILSTSVCILLLLTGLTPALASNNTNVFTTRNTFVTIEVNHHLGRHKQQTLTTVPLEEAEEIRQYLCALYDAQERKDYAAITYYESLLTEKGIFDERYQQLFLRNKEDVFLGKKNIVPSVTTLADENISNRLCFFNAIGEGIVAWWLALKIWEGIVRIIKNQTSALAALILLLVFLPYFVLALVFTNLIPFRIMTPIGALFLKNGTISCIGLNGFQRVNVGPEGYDVNLSWFTGLTINIPPINNRSSFLFISGFALNAEKIS